METSDIRFRGTYLKLEIEWLRKHAFFDENGECRCFGTKDRIRSRIVHRFRPKTTAATVPFTIHSTPGEGQVVTFTTVWCDGCGMKENPPSEVRLADLVTIENAEVAKGP